MNMYVLFKCIANVRMLDLIQSASAKCLRCIIFCYYCARSILDYVL
jgi:hypothetical protein